MVIYFLSSTLSTLAFPVGGKLFLSFLAISYSSLQLLSDLSEDDSLSDLTNLFSKISNVSASSMKAVLFLCI